MNSKFASLSKNEVFRGAVYAFVSAIFFGVYNHIAQKQTLPTWQELKPMLVVALTVLLGYVKVKYFANSAGELYTKEQPSAPKNQ